MRPGPFSTKKNGNEIQTKVGGKDGLMRKIRGEKSISAKSMQRDRFEKQEIGILGRNLSKRKRVLNL